jgi:hypothetical protein
VGDDLGDDVVRLVELPDDVLGRVVAVRAGAWREPLACDAHMRDRIATQVPRIRYQHVIEGDYTRRVPSRTTWFVDPPSPDTRCTCGVWRPQSMLRTPLSVVRIVTSCDGRLAADRGWRAPPDPALVRLDVADAYGIN